MQKVVYELGNSFELAFGNSVSFLHHSTSVALLEVGIYELRFILNESNCEKVACTMVGYM